VGTRDGRILWLDAQSGKAQGSWTGPGNEVVSAALCEEAGLALVGSENGRVRCLSIPAGEVQFDFVADDSAILALDATPDAQTLVTATGNRSLSVWKRDSAGTYSVYCHLPECATASKGLALSSNGKYLAVLSSVTGSVELWNLPLLQAELQRLGIE
jgi:WD40 repeat protein